MSGINADLIARALKGKRVGRDFVAHCPAHDDRNPSLSIKDTKDGRILVKCHAGCTQLAVIARLRELDLWPEAQDSKPLNRRRVIYTYVDESGRPLHRTIRTSQKTFPQEHLQGDKWVSGSGPHLVLYHLDELVRRKNEMVCIAEGEKDVDRLRSLGYLATCNPMGAGKWRQSYTDTLANRDIALFYDNDAPEKRRVGQEHATKVALALYHAGCKVRIIDLPQGKDVSDFLDAGATKQMLEDMIRSTPYLDSEGIYKWRARFDAGASSGTEWPDPILLQDDNIEPLRIDILPGVLGEYSQALTRFTETPPELPVLSVLGVLSTAAAGKAEVEAETGYVEPVNLYVCPLLESGNRKTAVIQHATKPLVKHEQEQRKRLAPEIKRIESERKTLEAIIDKQRRKLKDTDQSEAQKIAELEANLPVAPPVPTLFTADVTTERLEVLLEANEGRLAVISDEGGIFDVIAGRYNSAPNLDVWLKGHCGAPVRVHRMGRTTLIDKPYLTVLISPQPVILSGLRDKEFIRGRGLLARFLFALPVSPVGNRMLTPSPIPDRATEHYEDLVLNVLEWQPTEPANLQLSAGAYSSWKAFQRTTEAQMADGGQLCRLRDWASKLPGASLRLAGLLHLGRYAKALLALPLEIELPEIQTAVEICQILSSHAIAAFNIVSEDPILTRAKRLLRWICSQESLEISKRDCFRAHQPHLFEKVEEMDLPLRILIDHHLIRLGERKTAGRRSEMIEVNPALKGVR
jgi:hypothetical protein